MRRQDPSQIPGRHDPAGDWPGSSPISVKAMATCYLRGILSMQSENTLKMQGLEPSIDVDSENGFFEKGCQLNNYFFKTFLPSSRWSQNI